jgi:hypothetical protein
MFAVILFRTPQVFTHIAMVATPVFVLGVNHHYFSTHTTTEPALIPVGHVDLMPPSPTTGLAILLGFLGNNYLIGHIGQYKNSLSHG